MAQECTIKADYDRPIIFRTTSSEVHKKTIETGSIWLRSSEYYRGIEHKVRKDLGEGINATRTEIPLRFKPRRGPQISIQGTGTIGQAIVPHYIMSLHGAGISAEQQQIFGGFTFGLNCISRLSAEILYRVSKIIDVTGYRFGQISYQQTALVRSHSGPGAAIGLGGAPPEYLRSINTDVLRKDPVSPFIEQDEWRIVVFTEDFYKDDPNAPLEIHVESSHFYEYDCSNN